jgi:hypothetical protein
VAVTKRKGRKRTSSQSNQRAEPEKARRTTQISGMAAGPMIAWLEVVQVPSTQARPKAAVGTSAAADQGTTPPKAVKEAYGA